MIKFPSANRPFTASEPIRRTCSIDSVVAPAANPVANAPEAVANTVANKANRYADKEKRAKYMREYMAKKRAGK